MVPVKAYLWDSLNNWTHSLPFPHAVKHPPRQLQPTPETSSVVATAKHPVQSAHVTAPASSVLDQEVIWGGLSPTSFKTYSKNTSSPINRNDGL